jgi:hypothetical protein
MTAMASNLTGQSFEAFEHNSRVISELEAPQIRSSRPPATSKPSTFACHFPGLLAFLAIVLWGFSLSSVRAYQASEVGLISQLSILWWLGLAAAIAGLSLELRRENANSRSVILCLVAFVLIIHGTLPAVESVPRFTPAYDIAGFANYVVRTHHSFPQLDARGSWPAMFTAAAMAAESMHVSTLWFLRWCPLVLNLAYLIPVKAIANSALRTNRAQWAALAVFAAGNWIDEDYFSPQGFNLFLYLVAIAIVIRVFAPGGFPPRLIRSVIHSARWRRLTDLAKRAARIPGDTVLATPNGGTMSTNYRVAMFAVLLLILAASVTSHQVTPPALCLAFFALMLTGKTGLRLLWLLVGVALWVWLSWEAHDYWTGHLTQVLGSAGQITSTFSVSVSNRLHGASLDRLLVERGRVAGAVVTWFGAFLGLLVSLRRRRDLWTMAIITVAPLAVAGVVSYGGEIALRVLLFSLAPAAVLIASLIENHPKWCKASLAFVVIFLVLVALFPLNRYGNEKFDAIPPADVSAANWIHHHLKPGSHIYVLNANSSLNSANVGDYKEGRLSVLPDIVPQHLKRYLPNATHPTYIFLSRGQDEYGIDFQGEPANWMTQFEQRLLGTGIVRVIYRNSSSTVLQIGPKTSHHHFVRSRPKASDNSGTKTSATRSDRTRSSLHDSSRRTSGRSTSGVTGTLPQWPTSATSQAILTTSIR